MRKVTEEPRTIYDYQLSLKVINNEEQLNNGTARKKRCNSRKARNLRRQQKKDCDNDDELSDKSSSDWFI